MRLKMIRGFLCSVIVLLLAGQVLAVPAESSPVSVVRSQWRSGDMQQQADGISLLRDDETLQKAESLCLLSGFDRLALATTVDDLNVTVNHAQPLPSLAIAVMQGTWFDSALMQIIRPMDLVQHYKKNRRPKPMAAMIDR